MPAPTPLRVLVAGGGVAALETVLALQALAGERVAIELLAPGRHFTYQPLAVFEPFRSGDLLRLPLAAIAADRGVRLHRDALACVLPDQRAVETQDGARLDYDALVLALGARPVEAVRGALTFRGPRDAGRVAEVVERLRGSAPRRVVFVVPVGTTWALPLYVLALQTAAAVRGSAATRSHARHLGGSAARRLRRGGECSHGQAAGGAGHRACSPTRRPTGSPTAGSGWDSTTRSRPTA